jgi:hypothetical protein
MEKTLKIIQRLFLPEYFVVRKIYDIGNSYLFYIARKDAGDEDVLDPWYTIDKSTDKITGFVVHENLSLFSKAMQSEPVYTAK